MRQPMGVPLIEELLTGRSQQGNPGHRQKRGGIGRIPDIGPRMENSIPDMSTRFYEEPRSLYS